MPYPKKRRRPPAPQRITLRYEDGGEEVVPAGRFMEHQERRAARPVFEADREAELGDLHQAQRLLALQRGDALRYVPQRPHLWWFVYTVNGPERTVTARTVIFEQPVQHTMEFRYVEPIVPASYSEQSEIDVCRGQVDTAFRSARTRRRITARPQREAA